MLALRYESTKGMMRRFQNLAEDPGRQRRKTRDVVTRVSLTIAPEFAANR
jgi:hypothetical protein